MFPCNPTGQSLRVFGVDIPARPDICTDHTDVGNERDKVTATSLCRSLCPPPCHQTHYDVTTVVTSLGLPGNDSEAGDSWVDVYFQSYDVESVVSSPKYDVSRLVASYGGVVGLFAGLSLLTALEVLELVVDLVCSFFVRNSRK